MFKSIFGFLLCLYAIMFASLSFAELTPQDLKEIRLIVKEEIDKELTPIKADIVSLKEGFARLDARLSGVEKQIAMVANLVFALIALIVVAVGIPQLIMTWRSRKESASEMQIAALIQEQSKMLNSLTAEVETLREKVYDYFNEPQ